MGLQGALVLSVKLEAAESSGSLLPTRVCGEFDCVGNVAAVSMELGAFTGAASPEAHGPTLDKTTGWGHRKPRSRGTGDW